MADHKWKYGRCAVVGASGARPSRMYGKCLPVLELPCSASSALGAQIDTHDTVFRMNFAPVGPQHRALVGERSQLRVGNSWDTIKVAVPVTLLW